MKKAKSRQSGIPTSYRWGADDRELIASLAAQYPQPSGRPAREIDVLRAGLRALARECGIDPANSPGKT